MKIFVGGLYTQNESHLLEYFSKYGPIYDCSLMRDKYTGNSRGFGFITIYDPFSELR